MKEYLKRFSNLVYLLPFLPFVLFPFFNSNFFHLGAKESFALFTYYVLVFLLGLAVYPLMSFLFPRHPDKAYGASRILGLVLFSYILWSFCAFFDLPLLHWAGIAVLVILSFVFIIVILFRDDALLFAKHQKDILIVETLFSFLFFLFLIQASFHPEAFGGEKSMDFSLLSYFTRLEYLPPHDPWAHNSILRYYYWGYFVFAQLLKASGLTTSVGYLVAMATLPALMVTGSYTFILSVVRNRAFAIWGAFTLVLASNFQSLVNLFTKHTLDFSYFWSATRVFKNDLFAEFPSWSFTFLDLHPHVMDYPFVILALLFVWRLLEKPVKLSFTFCLFAGLSLGFLTVTNFWDYLIVGFVLALVTFLYFKKRIIPAFSITFFSLLFYLPILVRMFWGREGGVGLSFERETFNGFQQFMSHQGQWWFFFFWAILILGVTLLVKRKKIRLEFGFKSSLILLVVVSLLLAFSNYCILIDKINSVFKVNTQLWVLLGLAAFFFLRRFTRLTKWWALGFFLPLVLFSFLLLAGSVVNTVALAKFRKLTWDRPILSASAFVRSDDSELADIIDKMNTQVWGAVGFLEPYGKTYDFESNRLSIFTGLSSYLVWPGQHVNQRGLSWEAIAARKKEVEDFYANPTPLESCLFLTQNKIRLVSWTGEDPKLPCLKIWFKTENHMILERL